MDSFISTAFTKEEKYTDVIVNFYRTIRRYGCILTEHMSITTRHLESVLTIMYDGVIYQVIVVDGGVNSLYDLTNKIEYKEIQKDDR